MDAAAVTQMQDGITALIAQIGPVVVTVLLAGLGVWGLIKVFRIAKKALSGATG